MQTRELRTALGSGHGQMRFVDVGLRELLLQLLLRSDTLRGELPVARQDRLRECVCRRSLRDGRLTLRQTGPRLLELAIELRRVELREQLPIHDRIAQVDQPATNV